LRRDFAPDLLKIFFYARLCNMAASSIQQVIDPKNQKKEKKKKKKKSNDPSSILRCFERIF
jgi:hypothetical protein